jgi:hypothetical protein
MERRIFAALGEIAKWITRVLSVGFLRLATRRGGRLEEVFDEELGTEPLQGLGWICEAGLCWSARCSLQHRADLTNPTEQALQSGDLYSSRRVLTACRLPSGVTLALQKPSTGRAGWQVAPYALGAITN